jgi:hypothetical protein
MERIQHIDRELENCLELLRGMITSSTRTENPNMAMACHCLMNAMLQYNGEKMHILQMLANEQSSEVNPVYLTPSPIRAPVGEEEVYEYHEEEQDSGPLQLADLMEMENDMEVSREWGSEEDDDDQYWTDAQPRDEISDHVTVRANRHMCRRNYVAKETDSLNKMHTEMCNICFEFKPMNNICVTECGHDFCQSCFHTWETSDRNRAVTCPTCRAVRPQVTIYLPKEYFEEMDRMMDTSA